MFDIDVKHKVGKDGLIRLADGSVWEKDGIGIRMIPKLSPKFIVANGETIELRYGEDGHWADAGGTVFAIIDDTATVDNKVRCGVGWLSFPESHLLTPACRAHDYAYSSPSYQIFKSRRTADRMLADHVSIVAEKSLWKLMKIPFFLAVSLCGRFIYKKRFHERR